MRPPLPSGLFSFLISLEFYILQAPDVAISQAAIGAGLTTAIFIIAIRSTKRYEEDVPMRKILSLIAIILFGVFLSLLAIDLTFGVPENTRMDDYFIKNGQEQSATNNIVTTVVFDYRGFDTLGRVHRPVHCSHRGSVDVS